MEIPKQFAYVKLGFFFVMPNHIHGILIINHRTPIGLMDGDGFDARIRRDAINRVSTTTRGNTKRAEIPRMENTNPERNFRNKKIAH